MSGFNSVNQGFLGGGSSGSGPSTTVPISGLLAGTAINSINNGAFQQTWQWNGALSGGLLLSSDTTTAANSSYLLGVAVTGLHDNSGTESFAADISNTHSGTSSINVGMRVVATGAETNYAIIVPANSGFTGLNVSNPVSTFEVNGSIGASIIQISEDTTLDGTHFTVLVDASAGNVTVNLPTVTTSFGRIYNIQKIDNTTNTVTIDPTGIQKINDQNTKVITSQYEGYQIQNDGAFNWYTYSPAPSLTSTYIGYGDGSNLLTGSAALTFDGGSFQVGSVARSLLTNNGETVLGDLDNDQAGDILKVDVNNGVIYADNTAHTSKFGINTNSPSVALDVLGDVNLGKDGDYPAFGLLGTDKGAKIAYVGDYSQSQGGNTIVINDNTSLGYIDNTVHDTKFGINISTPTVALDVVGGANDIAKFTPPSTQSVTISGSILDDEVGLFSEAQTIIAVYHPGGSNYQYGGGNVEIAASGGATKIVDLAGTGTRTVLADASGVLSAPISDRTVKENINDLQYGIQTLMQLKPVTFEYKTGWTNFGKGEQIGFIAQDIEKVLPSITFTTPKTGKMGYNAIDLVPVLVKAVQEQQLEIEKLKKQISNN